MRLPRMTIRRLMTVVAGLGLLFGLFVWGRSLKLRRDYCLREASAYAEMETDFMAFQSKSRAVPGSYSATVSVDENSYRGAKAVAYLVEMKNSYRHAAFRPWVSIPTKPKCVAIQTDNPRTVQLRVESLDDIFLEGPHVYVYRSNRAPKGGDPRPKR